MPRGNRKSEFDDYTEKLIPTRVTITKQRGNFTYVFEIDGFKGAETGQVYYKGKDVLEVERFMESGQAIRTIKLRNYGLVLNFETPQAFLTPGALPTGTAIALPEIYRMLPAPQTTLCQYV
jgi:hypothetical protein